MVSPVDLAVVAVSVVPVVAIRPIRVVMAVRTPVDVDSGSALVPSGPLVVGERRKRATGEKQKNQADKEGFHLVLRRGRVFGRGRGNGLCLDMVWSLKGGGDPV